MSIYYPLIDEFEELLLIDNEKEMDLRISNNYPKITIFFKNILKRLKKNYIPKEEIKCFVYALKFIDNLNLFIEDTKIKEFLNLMKEINTKLKFNKRIEYETKNYMIGKINYTESTFITYRKEYYKKLFFINPNEIMEEIESELEKVNKNGKFDHDLFQQIQNLFWILKKRIYNVEDKEYLENKMNQLKKTNYNYDSYYNYFYRHGKQKYKNRYDNNNSDGNKKVNIYNKTNNNKNTFNQKEENNNNKKDNEKNKGYLKINDLLILKNINNNTKNNEIIINNKVNKEKESKITFNEINKNLFNDIKYIDKIKINENEANEDIIEKNNIHSKKIVYNIMNNIHEFYSNYNKFNCILNNFANEKIKEDNKINYKIKYLFSEKNEIEEFYNQFIIDFKEAKSKENSNIKKIEYKYKIKRKILLIIKI